MRRGRPANGPLESLKVKLWIALVAAKVGKKTGYGLEKHFSPETIRIATDGGTIRSCKFDKYIRGEHVPEPELVDKIEIEFPGTKAVLEHPFWVIANPSITGIEALYNELNKLRSGITKLLFFTPLDSGRMPNRTHNKWDEQINLLVKESDWDALTACIGLIQEARYLGNPPQPMQHLYAKKTLGVFLPAISQYPFTKIADELFLYLREHFLENKKDKDWTKILNEIELDKHILTYQNMRMLIEDLQIFQTHFFTPQQCLYIADKYLKPPVIAKIFHLFYNGQFRAANNLPEVKKLKRCLRKWEKKVAIDNGTIMTLV